MVRIVLAVLMMFLIGLAIIPVFADAGTMSVVSGKTYQVNYNANGVKILDMETNPTYDELTVSVQVSSPNASLELTIPRSLLDSKQGNSDIPFIVVADGTLANVAEKSPTSSTRTISIQLSPGNQQVEVIGTFVAVSGPSGSNVIPTPPITKTPQQTIPQSPSIPTPTTTQIQQAVPPAPPVPQSGVHSENAATQENITQNISFAIPYVKSMNITLSYIDLSVIGAICIVIIIVIASATRKRTTKTAARRL